MAAVIGSLVLAAALVTPWSASADGLDQRLRVGKTGIMCVRLPCPSRGVFLPTGGGLNERRRALLYTDADGKSGPPVFIGSPGSRKALEHAWQAMECIEIMGHLEQGPTQPPRLHVARILGPCR